MHPDPPKMSLKKVLDIIIQNTIQDIEWRRDQWKVLIKRKKNEIAKIREEIRELQTDLVVENELLKKYKETNFDDILNKTVITTEDKIELLKKTHIPRD